MNDSYRNIPLPVICQPNADQHCLTCSDEALPVKVVHIDEEAWLALVEVGQRREEIDITLVENVVLGDILLVHGGVAIAHLEKEHNL